MTLADGDYITGAAVVDESGMLLSITENGYGKLTPFADYTTHGRGGKGIVCHAITEKTGLLCGIAAVSMEDDVMMITNEGTMIRTPVSEIRVCGRPSQGVIVMRMTEGAHVVNFAPVRDEESAAKEAEENAALVRDDDVENEDSPAETGAQETEEIELLDLDDVPDTDTDDGI